MTKNYASLNGGGARIEVGPHGIRLYDESTGQLLIDTKGNWPLRPVIDGTPQAVKARDIRATEGQIEIDLESETGGLIRECRLTLRKTRAAFDLSCEFVSGVAGQMNALEVFPAGSVLNFYDVVNIRNRHFTPAIWPELLLGGELKTSTYSDDWQFAPHPTAVLLRKVDTTIFVGFADLLPGFGMRLEAKRFLTQRWEVDFGPQPNGLPLAEGQIFRSGRLRFFLRKDAVPQDIFTEFGGMLIEDGTIPDPAKKVRHAWWREPLYCTWGDQWMISEKPIAESLAEQTAEGAVSAAETLTEKLIWRAVDVIKREKFPIRTIVLDEGWAKARGDWQPDPKRLPNLRGIVDRLHAEGFKVMVWWNWAEIANDAEVDTKYLAGDGWKNKHGCRWRDYSDPRVQEEYLKPLFRTLFSADADCLDLDGVKTDFLADKVHPETPLSDPAWRGEEIYFLKITELFYREMRSHKPDACHLGCAGHYWLAEFTDLNRTYDVHTSNWLEHEERGRMLACTSPGVPVSYDMMTCTENTDFWFASAACMGASLEIGNLIYMRKDCLSDACPVDADYLALLRRGFAAQETK